jgi:general secretion pathway protein F/type IV pilus assembly protein PilC
VPTFEYTALSGSGERVAGVLAGASEQAVLVELESRRLVPVSIKAQKERSQGRAGRIPQRALANSYLQMSDLLRAGVPLLRSLKLLAGRKSKPAVSAVFRELADAVEKGSDLGAAMSNLAGVFPPVHVAMVRAGEKGGFLEDVLARLGTLVMKQAEMRSKVIGNMIYPALLLGLGLIVGVAIFGFFIPKFRPMFANLKGGLPMVTKLVFAISDGVGKYGPITAAVLVVLGVAVWRLSRRADVRERIEVAKLQLPVIGGLVRGFATARLCQLLGTMLSNGVPMLAALKIAKDGTGNMLMSRAIEKAADSVKEGQPLATPLGQSGLLEDDVVEMISVGESANNLDEVLLKVGDSIETRLDRMLGSAVRLIEPLLLLVMASVVGIVAAALLLPMSKLSSSL